MTTLDERLGLPSASSMERLANCPASPAAERLAEEADAVAVEESLEEVTSEGTLAHEWLAADMKDEPILKAEIEARVPAHVIEKAHTLREKREALLEQWESGWRDKPHSLVFVEKRFWANSSTADKLFSAQPDLVVISGKRACVINYKAGWKDPAEAPGNWQVKTEVAVLFASMPQLVSIVGAIVTPTNTPLMGEWSKDGLDKNLSAVSKVAAAAASGTGAITSGNWCRYCKARGICPEASKMAVAIVPEQTSIEPVKPVAQVALMQPEAVAEVWRKSSTIKAILEAVRERLGSMPDDQLAALGIGRKPGRMLAPKVTAGPLEVMERLGWTPEEMLGALEISLPKLEDAWRAKHGTTKDIAERDVRFALKSVIEQGRARTQLVDER